MFRGIFFVLGKINWADFSRWDGFVCPHERLPDPEIYKKAILTQELEKMGMDHKYWESHGGLMIDSYQALLNRMNQKYDIFKQFRENITEDKLNQLKSDSKICNGVKRVNGSKNIVVLRADFPDKQFETDVNHLKNLLFSSEYDYSMKNYFLEVSWGALKIEGVISEDLTLNKPYGFYVDEAYSSNNLLNWELPQAQELVKEAIYQAAVNPDFNFKSFDDDGNKVVVIVVFPGEGFNKNPNQAKISPHQARLSEPILLEGDMVVEKYILINELPKFDVGGFCHEMGHILGLPDLYMPDGSSTVVGRWCLMGLGNYNNDGRTPAHMSAWCKSYLGWVDPIKIVGNPRMVKIPEISHEKIIYKLVIPGSDEKEYFLVENRQKTGFDKYLPAEGLLIWHLNENNCLKRFPNMDSQNLFITLEQSDGNKELERRFFKVKSSEDPKISKTKFEGDEGDVYPGVNNNTIFSDHSVPSSQSSSGDPSGVIIKSISSPNQIMWAEMGYLFSSGDLLHPKNSDYYDNGYYDGFADGFQQAISDMKNRSNK